jgi:hypothetical protein
MAEPSLLSQWAVCGIAAAAARFVPVPLLDDVIRQRATQVAVVQTLRAHDRNYEPELLQPLWGEREGQPSGLRRRLRAVSRRLLLFPVRKYMAVFGAVRGVPADVLRVVLLARTVDRRLDRGELTGPHGLPEQARGLRGAVDEAIEGMDLRLLTAALGDGLSHSRGLSTAAVAFARRRLVKVEPDAALVPDGAVAEGAERVSEVLRRPEMAQLLGRFDAQVDAVLASRR